MITGRVQSITRTSITDLNVCVLLNESWLIKSHVPRNEREDGGVCVSGAPFRGEAAGSAAACSRQSLVSSGFSEFPPQRGRRAVPGRGCIGDPCWGSCDPLPCRCPPVAEGSESNVLTLRPRFPRYFCTLGHVVAAARGPPASEPRCLESGANS
jgi:hypothetical protein